MFFILLCFVLFVLSPHSEPADKLSILSSYKTLQTQSFRYNAKFAIVLTYVMLE